MPGVVLRPLNLWGKVKDWSEAILGVSVLLVVIVTINVIEKVREWRGTSY